MFKNKLSSLVFILLTFYSFKLGLKTKYINDHRVIESDTTVFTIKLSGNNTVRDLPIIPELHLDSSSDDFFPNHGVGSASSLASFLPATVYKC
ncbi:MAG: hypothetical protein MK076_07170 [Flavobacteriales bacterium]|nr:hypothetical protein [Flavobacteriales bacterium]